MNSSQEGKGAEAHVDGVYDRRYALPRPAYGFGQLPLSTGHCRIARLTLTTGTGGGNWADEVEETYGKFIFSPLCLVFKPAFTIPSYPLQRLVSHDCLIGVSSSGASSQSM